jgi:hypothetical protein
MQCLDYRVADPNPHYFWKLDPDPHLNQIDRQRLGRSLHNVVVAVSNGHVLLCNDRFLRCNAWIPGLRIRNRIIFGSWIRIRIREKSWTRIRIIFESWIRIRIKEKSFFRTNF